MSFSALIAPFSNMALRSFCFIFYDTCFHEKEISACMIFENHHHADIMSPKDIALCFFRHCPDSLTISSFVLSQNLSSSPQQTKTWFPKGLPTLHGKPESNTIDLMNVNICTNDKWQSVHTNQAPCKFQGLWLAMAHSSSFFAIVVDNRNRVHRCQEQHDYKQIYAHSHFAKAVCMHSCRAMFSDKPLASI